MASYKKSLMAQEKKRFDDLRKLKEKELEEEIAGKKLELTLSPMGSNPTDLPLAGGEGSH